VIDRSQVDKVDSNTTKVKSQLMRNKPAAAALNGDFATLASDDVDEPPCLLL
jgi:hypothetical protein